MCLQLWGGAAGMAGHRVLLDSISQEGNSICDICQRKKNAKEEGSATPDAFSPGFFADFCHVDDPAHCKMHDWSSTRLLENHPKSQSSLLKVPLFELEEHPWRVQGVGPNPKTTNLRSVCVGPTPNTTFSSFQKGKTGLSKWQSNFYQEDRLSCDQGLFFIYFKNSIALDFYPSMQLRIEWWVSLLQDHWLNSFRRFLTRQRSNRGLPRHLCTLFHSTRGLAILPYYSRFMPTTSSDTQPDLPPWILAVLVPGKIPGASMPKLLSKMFLETALRGDFRTHFLGLLYHLFSWKA